MGSEGHVFDMIARSRQNREMLKSRRERVRQIREIYLAHYHVQTSKSQAPVNLKAIKEEIRRKLEQKRKRAWLITGIILVFISAIILFVCLTYHPFSRLAETFSL